MTKNNDLKMPIDTQLTTLFCLIDDFCTDISEWVEQYMLTCGKSNRVFADSATRGKLLSIGFMVLRFIFAALTLYALMLVNGYKSGIQQILKPIELKSA